MNFYQLLTFAGLGTLTFTVPGAGPFFIDIKSSIPTLSNGGGVSGMTITVKQNGTTV